jgi:SAM-dependent methyltransferase
MPETVSFRGLVATSASHEAAAADAGWTDESTALEWASGDRLGDLLSLPRRLAVAVAAADLGEFTQVVDVGSGPGEFLAAALERCQEAHGTWIDVSPAMERLARVRLGGLASRVEFSVTDLSRLGQVVPSGSADLVVSSRVTHHLGADELTAFYGQVARVLRPGGWLANLDHMTIAEPWGGRLRRARAELLPVNPSRHPHDHPLPAARQHADALAAAGFTDLDMPWRAFWSVLVLARKPGPARFPGAPGNPDQPKQPSEEGQTR